MAVLVMVHRPDEISATEISLGRQRHREHGGLFFV